MFRLRNGRQRISSASGALVATMAMLLVNGGDASGQDTRTWNGGSGLFSGNNNNWDTNANWGGSFIGGGTAPNGNDILVFAGTTRTTNTNNFSGASNQRIEFASGAGAFTQSGNLMTLTAANALTNSSTNLQTMNLPLTFSAATATIAATSGNFTLGGALGGSALTFTGGSTSRVTTLNGSNTYTGLTTVASGALDIANATALGTTAAGTTVSSGAELRLRNSISVAAGEGLTLNGGGGASTGALRNISGNNTWAGSITLSTASRINSDSGTLTLSGPVGGSQNLTLGGVGSISASGPIVIGSAALTKDGIGTLTLSGTNTYTGATAVNAGTLRAGAAAGGQAFGNLSAVTMANVANALLDLNGFSQAVGSLAGGGASGGNVLLGSATLTTGGSNVNSSYDGVISGTGGLAKVGSGVQTLTRGNTYSGLTTVASGALEIANATALGTTAAGTTVSSGAELRLQNSISVAAGEGLTLNGGGGASTGALRNISGTNTWAGSITLATASRINSDSGTLTLSGPVGGSQNLTLGGVGSISASGLIGIGSATLTKDGTGTHTLSGTNTYTGATAVNAGTLRAGASAGGQAFGNLSAVTIANVANALLDLNGFSQAVGSLAGGGASGGNVSLGSGTLTTGGSNASTSYGGVISGTGGLTKVGGGTQTLSGDHTYGGATNVNAGTLAISSGNINGTSAINVAAGASFVYNGSTPLNVAPTLNGIGPNRATLSGSGSINAPLSLTSIADVLSPGNSPGIQSFDVAQVWTSFTYEWETKDWASPVAGSNHDQIQIAGTLNLDGATYGLNILSLMADNTAGDVPNFVEADRTWTILTTTGGITGFDPSEWTIDTTDFSSSPGAAGSWNLAQSGNSLVLNYVAVPEPATFALAAASGAIGLWLLRRKHVS